MKRINELPCPNSCSLIHAAFHFYGHCLSDNSYLDLLAIVRYKILEPYKVKPKKGLSIVSYILHLQNIKKYVGDSESDRQNMLFEVIYITYHDNYIIVILLYSHACVCVDLQL
jgi:hypothetical protein